MGKEFSLQFVFIEPYSIVIGRRDVFQAGADGAESNGKRCARLHMSMTRAGVAFCCSINDVVCHYMSHIQEDRKKSKEKLVKTF